MNYFEEAPISVTICDKDGKILSMNQQSIATFCKDGKSLVGNSLLDCHPEPARTKLLQLLENRNVNAYTIEKNGIKKMIYQMPWYQNNEFAGYIELSLVIPFDMPHYIRQPKQQ